MGEGDGEAPVTDFRKMSDDELVRFVAGHAGAAGNGALAEILRRLNETMAVSNAYTRDLAETTASLRADTEIASRATTRLTTWLLILTWVLVGLGVATVAVTMWAELHG